MFFEHLAKSKSKIHSHFDLGFDDSKIKYHYEIISSSNKGAVLHNRSAYSAGAAPHKRGAYSAGEVIARLLSYSWSLIHAGVAIWHWPVTLSLAANEWIVCRRI